MSEELIGLELSEKWVTLLWKRLMATRKQRLAALSEINDTILYSDPLELAKVYVEPYCQEVNPADRHDEDFFAAREHLFRKVSEFFKLRTFQQGNNQLFILSDAGMGKTSFLVMLKLLHLTAFWPGSYSCTLLKLGENSLATIREMPEKRRTVLLLDSLDEDTLAYGRSRERLLEILEASQTFHKVIITCRTQFFPSVDKDPLEYPGRVRIGSFVCPSKYISLFNDDQVDSYLRRRFPRRLFGSNRAKIVEAKKIVNRMASLRCRPMLLSFIEDLVNSPAVHGVGSEYTIYNSLVKSWLLREQSKTGHDSQILLRACAELAFKMQSRKLIKVPPDQLNELISQIECMGPLKEIDITGRSLINKNSAGEYRFSHYSIQEFLVVLYIFSFASIDSTQSIYPTDFIKKLIEQNKAQLRVRIEQEVLNHYRSIEVNPNPFQGVDELRFHGRAEVLSLIREVVPDLDDLNIVPYTNMLDIPTYLRRKVLVAKRNLPASPTPRSSDVRGSEDEGPETTNGRLD